jgi:hypothetical protein
MALVDGLSKLLGVFIAIFLLIIFPLSDSANKMDNISYANVYSEASILLDSARDLGYITPEMYKLFQTKIAATGNIYDITIEHTKNVFYPNAAVPSGFTIVEESYYNEDILENILFNSSLPLDQRIYSMNQGDTLIITVMNTNKTMADTFKFLMIGSQTPGPSIYVKVGGVIRNEYY